MSKEFDNLLDALNHIEIDKFADCDPKHIQNIADNYLKFITNAHTIISQQEFNALVIHLKNIHYILYITEQTPEQPLKTLLGSLKKIAHNKPKIQQDRQSRVFKCLLMCELNQHTLTAIDKIAPLDPKNTWLCLLCLLCLTPRLSADDEAVYQGLIEKFTQLPLPNLPRFIPPILLKVWFNSLYEETPTYHALRHTINATYRQWANQHLNIAPMEKPQHTQANAKPNLLIVLEFFHSQHSMYRCYKPIFMRLRKSFHLIAVTHTDNVDEKSKALFDEVLEFQRSRPKDMQQLIELMQSKQTDIIFFPSVGMQYSALLLANLRLAPIQIISPGHANTTLCDSIDYNIIHQELYDANANYSEKIIALPPGGVSFMPQIDWKNIEKNQRGDEKTIRIAVIAMRSKLNPSFIHTCQTLQQQHSHIEFVFFPAVGSIDLMYLQKHLTQLLPNSQIHPMQDHKDFLQRLLGCDFALSPFPFGSTNSSIDALYCGLPVVSLLGPFATARVDKYLINNLELPDWLITDTITEYSQAALKLISEPKTRLAIREQIYTADLEKLFYCPESSVNHYCDAFIQLQRQADVKKSTILNTMDLKNMES